MPEGTIRVVVADDDSRFRRMVVAQLADEPDIDVVTEAADGRQAVERAAELAPDVVLLDIRMPGGGGIEAARAIKRRTPTTKVVMLTASDEDDDVYAALRAGASGYVVKGGLPTDLAGVVRAMAQNLGLLLSPSIAAKMLAEFRDHRPEDVSAGLSGREVDVLRLVGLGKTNDKIGDELFLSSHTVKRHVANILAKLHERTRADAVVNAIRRGYLSDDGTVLASV